MRIFLLTIMFFGLTFLSPNNMIAQTTWETVSKSCLSCNKGVSINSKIGMKCPHCRVIWTDEKTTYDETIKTYDYPTPSINTVKNYTYRQCNAIAKSTKKRCKRGVSASSHNKCYQHR